jgi:GT2 family glycosyltransferase
LEKTVYQNYEVIGVSNDSYNPGTYDAMEELKRLDGRVAFREFNEPFNFSRIVNFGVGEATGEHIVLMNNDIEIISEDWIEGFLEHSQRDDVAAVGGKLYYPNNRIQHAGIAVCRGGFTAYLHKNFRADSPGYFNRLNVTQNVTAVSGALMMVEKAKYIGINGFDEANFDVSCGDIDFCLRAGERGYLNVFTPYVEAYHHESASNIHESVLGAEKRLSGARENLYNLHRKVVDGPDPYYNPNFNQRREDFTYTG